MTTLRSLKYASAFLAGLTAVSVAPGSGTLIEGRARAAEAPQPAPAPAKTDCALNESELRAAYDPSVLRSGDRLKLAFYEILEPQDDKWGADKQRLQEPTKGIQLRAELSKEYVVRDDGTISIPILGSFALDGKRQSDVQAKLASAFETFLGRKGFVDIAEVARRPIYVVGKVKNSGSYEYTPGMTVLHADRACRRFQQSARSSRGKSLN